MATTNVNTDANRLKTLQDKGLGESRAALNLQDKIGGGGNTMSPTVSKTAQANKDRLAQNKAIRQGAGSIISLGDELLNDIQTVETGKADATLSENLGGKTVAQVTADATSNASRTSAPAAKTVQTSLTDTSGGGADGSSTAIGGSNGGGGTSTPKDRASITDSTTNKVVGESVSQYEDNKTIDRTQYEKQKLAYEAAAMETDTELKRFELEKNKLATEEEARIKAKAASDEANLRMLQEKERAANEASISAAQAKADAEERELQIANDIELQKSNVAFAKLGLNLSAAAVTQAQQIYTTGVYNLSKLKTENAFKMASLQVEVAKVEFDHTSKINDIINKSSEDSYKIRKTLSDEVHVIKNSITTNRLERQERIDAAIDNYQKAIYDNQKNVIDGISKANKTLDDQVKGYYDTLKTKEEYNSNKIDTLISSGKWYAMTPYAQTNFEKGAGLPIGTVARKITSVIGSKIYSQAQELTGLKGITFSSGTYSLMISEAQNLTQAGVPFETAINQVISKYISESPEYQNALAKQRKDATIKASGGGGGASYGTAQPKEVYVDGKLQLVQFLPGTKGNVGKYVNNDGTPITGTISDVGGTASYGTAQPKEVYIDGKLQVVQFLPGTKGNTGKYVYNDGTPVTGVISDVGENTADKKLSLAESIKAATAAKKTTTK